MIVSINGEKKNIAAVNTLEGLLRIAGVTPESKGVAVALNGEVVPRSAWASARVQENDSVEIIHAVQGG
jgi:sulfur carrier protein